MDFKNYLNTAALEIEQEIENFFQIWLQEVQKISPTLLPLAQVLQDHCKGGKRLRGALVKLGYELLKGKNKKDILKVSAAVEIFQTAILAHDDIIDQSPIRRGRPTIFKELGGNHYGVAQTICLGDIGFFLAVRLISESNFPSDKKNQAISAFTQTVINTGLGQMLDIKGGESLTIHKLKTSYYTIINPLQLGAILAGDHNQLLSQIENYGENLGLAFQLQDDILGMFGDEKTLGKSVTSDLEEGKNTLLITYALKKANPSQKKVLQKYYGKKVSEKGLEEVKKVFIDTGSLDYSKKQALNYVEKAKKFIPKITNDPKYQQLLSELANFVIERKN